MAFAAKRKRIARYWEINAAKAMLLWPEDCRKVIIAGAEGTSKTGLLLKSLSLNNNRTNRARFHRALIQGQSPHAIQARASLAQPPSAGAVANVRLTANAIASGYLPAAGK